jgi:hypothetical protein
LFQVGETYFILVHTYGQFRIFSLSISRPPEYVPSPGDNCGLALLVDIDTRHMESIGAAAVSDFAPACAAEGVSPGFWFQIVGDGTNIEASTCEGASFDSQISVYTGGCDSLECVDGNDDFCGSLSSVSWLSRVSIWAAI